MKFPITFGDGSGQVIVQISDSQKIAEWISKTSSVKYSYTYNPGLGYPPQTQYTSVSLKYYEKTWAKK